MTYVLQGEATVTPPPAGRVLAVVGPFPAVVGLSCAVQHQRDGEGGTERRIQSDPGLGPGMSFISWVTRSQSS